MTVTRSTRELCSAGMNPKTSALPHATSTANAMTGASTPTLKNTRSGAASASA
jgi:hypothetical protein